MHDIKSLSRVSKLEILDGFHCIGYQNYSRLDPLLLGSFLEHERCRTRIYGGQCDLSLISKQTQIHQR